MCIALGVFISAATHPSRQKASIESPAKPSNHERFATMYLLSRFGY
jgi:hypothetical protein